MQCVSALCAWSQAGTEHIVDTLRGQCMPSIPLFQQLPTLADHVSYLPLGAWPTPLQKMDCTSREHDVSLYVKRDDLSGRSTGTGRWYGGNKVRKLEFLLADAQCLDAKEVYTFGRIGSNHVSATAYYAKELGLQCSAFLLPQPQCPIVDQSLRFKARCDCACFIYDTVASRDKEVAAMFAHRVREQDQCPYVIPTGSSNAVGILGSLNGFLELSDQVKQPFGYIYATGGSLGTAVGLWLGMMLTDSPTTLRVVDVCGGKSSAEIVRKMKALFFQTVQYIQQYVPTFEVQPDDTRLEIIDQYVGKGYGRVTTEARDATKYMAEREGIELDHTYSSTCLLDDMQSKHRIPKAARVLFWHAYCPLDTVVI